MTDTTRPTHTTDACGKDSAYGKDIAMTVIGAGSYGTSLAISLARNGANVVLWGHDPIHLACLESERANNAFLHNIDFTASLIIESNLEKAVPARRDLLGVVPSNVVSTVFNSLQPHI